MRPPFDHTEVDMRLGLPPCRIEAGRKRFPDHSGLTGPRLSAPEGFVDNPGTIIGGWATAPKIMWNLLMMMSRILSSFIGHLHDQTILARLDPVMSLLNVVEMILLQTLNGGRHGGDGGICFLFFLGQQLAKAECS